MRRRGRLSGLTGVREFVRPVSDAELPELMHRMRTGARVIAAIAIVIGPAFGLVAWTMGPMDAWRHILVAVGFTMAFGLAYALASMRTERVSPHVSAAVTLMLAVVACTFTGRLVGTMGEVASYVVVTPLVASAFFPWRPTWSLLLGVASTALPLLAVPDNIGVPVTLHLLLGAVYTAFAATANQLHRRVWLELEWTRKSVVALDRMSTLGRMLAGIAHELKTPTAAAANSFAAICRLSDELARSVGHDEVTDDDLREIGHEIAQSTRIGARAMDRAARFLQAIRAKTLGTNETRLVAFDVTRRIADTVALLEPAARSAGIRIVEPSCGAVQVWGDPGKLEQVVTNLVGNALDAGASTGQGTVVRIEIARRDGGVVLAIEDDGPGIPAAHMHRVFEPLFTTRAAEGGTGLGLSICRDIVEGAFGGTLVLVEGSTGTRFEAWLPDGGARGDATPAYAPSAHARSSATTT